MRRTERGSAERAGNAGSAGDSGNAVTVDATKPNVIDARPIAIVVALKDEERAVLPSFAHRRWERSGPLRYRRGRIRGQEVLVARSGIGAARAEECAALLLGAGGPRLVVMVGFGGGLRADLRAGDLVVATEVVECGAVHLAAESGPEVAGPEVAGPWASPPDLVAVLERLAPSPGGAWPFRIVSGRIATVDRVVASAAAKRALGERLGALAVDMESGAVFRAAAARGIPALAVRSVLDDAEREIPFDFGRLLAPTGRPRPFRLFGALVREPGRIRDLVDLRARARTAAGTLAAYVPRLAEALRDTNREG